MSTTTSARNSDVPSLESLAKLKNEAQPEPEPEWKATTQVKLIIGCLAAVSLVVALDATILVTALPVSRHPVSLV